MLNGDHETMKSLRADAYDLVINGMNGAIAAKTVTYDFHRLMEGATLLKCSEFGDAVIGHMGAEAQA